MQNPPGGLPLLKAISSQNECGSTIGLALISIHLACLCVETAGAAAGGGGAMVSACNCVVAIVQEIQQNCRSDGGIM